MEALVAAFVAFLMVVFSAAGAAQQLSSGDDAVQLAFQALHSNGHFVKFLSLADRTKLPRMLEHNTKAITIFAPYDSAFSNLSPQVLGGLDDAQLRQLLEFHVLPDYYSRSDLVKKLWKPIPTLASSSSSSGFQLQVLPGLFISTGITVVQMLNTVFDMKPDVVVYAVSEVLLPPQILLPSPPPPPPVTPAAAGAFRALEQAPHFTKFLSLLKSYKLVSTIEQLKAFTLFAPTDEALQQMLSAKKAVSSAKQVLEYHVLPAYYTPWQLLVHHDQPLQTLASRGKAMRFVMSLRINIASPLKVDVHTGIVNAHVTAVVLDDHPVAVYAVDRVLLPAEILS